MGVDLVRRWVSRLLQLGQLSRAAYRVLTGLAMLVVADLLWSARGVDRAAGPVALAFLVGGIIMIGLGAKARLGSFGGR